MLASFFFLNPFTMIIGSVLIASPIIIHLINRMRFKRIRWAAMEFLLKAQKRSRRKLIIEQMILLFLRILLVLLVALLLGRLIEQKPEPPKPPDVDKPPPEPTRHVIVIDDTASMNDRFRNANGQEILAIEEARRAVLDFIVDPVKDSSDPHEVAFVSLSGSVYPLPNADKSYNFLPISAVTRSQIEDYVRNRVAVQPNHFELLPALNQAKEIFKESKASNLVLHVVSDFRASDWNDSTKDALGEAFKNFELGKVQVKLHDIAAPLRDQGQKPVISSGNLAIIDFRPESRVVVKDFPVEFTVTVANYSTSDKPVFVRVRVNNEEKLDAAVNIPLIRAGDTVTARVTFALNRTAPKDPNLLKDGARKFDGFNLISASIENDSDGDAGAGGKGLTIDNVRFTFVEVRDKMPILLVDNNIADRFTKNSESFYLWKLYSDTYKGFDVQIRTATELEKTNLQNYTAVILCDIPTMSDAVVKKLETYVESGGGVGFFMGPSVRDPKFYNEKLWKKGAGMFPAPLEGIANKDATNEQLDQILRDQRNSFNKKLLVRKEVRRLPAMEKLYSDSRGQNFNDDSYERIFYLVAFARYYVVDRRNWKPSDNVQTLLYLPNSRPIGDFERPTKELLRKLRETINLPARQAALQRKLDETTDDNGKKDIQQRIEGLKVEMEKYAKYSKTVDEYATTISNTVGKYDNPLHKLVVWMEVLLEDPGDESVKPAIPSMAQMWQIPELADLKQEFSQLLNVIKFGDPFYIAKQYGKGRVLAFMGSAGASGPEGDYWSPLNNQGREFFPPLMKDSLQRYLCSTSSDFYLPLLEPFEFDLDPATHEKDVHVWKVQEVEKPANDEDRIKVSDLNVRNIAGAETELKYKFVDGKEPGMYLFDFAMKPSDAIAKKDAMTSDLRALAYNFDGRRESNLLRARSDDLKSIARVERIDTLDAKSLPKKLSREKERDISPPPGDLGLSEKPWYFLGIVLALILEQAWAVRLSFHTRNTSGPNIPQPVGRSSVVA